MEEDLLEGFLMQEDEPKYKPRPEQDPVSNNYISSSVDNIFKNMSDSKIMNAKEVIDDINELIDERKSLQQELFKDINGILLNINNFLSSTGDKIDAVEKLKLQQKLIEIEEFKMQEKVNAFRDIANLKRELRDRMQEYKDQQSNASVLDKILEA